jgi:glycosyltransferase involved in cell wall biosynthesis
MEAKPNRRIVMLGAAPDTRGSSASVVEACRAHGLFRRWPIDFIATHCDGSLAQQAALAFKALREFLALLAREPRVAVHVHVVPHRAPWREALFMALALVARRRVLVQLHGAGFERFYDSSGPGGRGVLRFFFDRAACVIVPSESQRAWVRGVSRNAHVVCLPHPVEVQPAGDLAGRQKLILFLGRLEAAKGVFDLLEAVAGLRGTVPDVLLVCAGEGDRAAVARYAGRLGIADAVKFTGWVGPSGKRALLESAAVFALPSYDEVLPISLLEAMAAGVPVVVSPVGGVPEVVVDGVSGFCAAPGDISTLQRLLKKLLLDRRLGARIAAAARESVRLRCSPERALVRLGELYAGLGLRESGEAPVPLRQARAPKAAI